MGITKQRAVEACRAIVRNVAQRGQMWSFLNRLPDEKLTIVPEDASNEEIVAFLQAEMAGGAGPGPGSQGGTTTSKEVTLVEIEEGIQKVSFSAKFKSPASFKDFLVRSGAKGVFTDSNELLMEFDDLEDGGVYSLDTAPDLRKVLAEVRREQSHQEQGREDELGKAMLQDAIDDGIPGAHLAPDLRIIKDSTGKDLQEADAVVMGDHEAIIGFHVVNGQRKSVSEAIQKTAMIAKRSQDTNTYPGYAPFAGKVVVPAFMSESVEGAAPGYAALKQACKRGGVKLYARNGKAISKVVCGCAPVVTLRVKPGSVGCSHQPARSAFRL